jgi:hypothetical protein
VTDKTDMTRIIAVTVPVLAASESHCPNRAQAARSRLRMDATATVTVGESRPWRYSLRPLA